MKMESTWWAPHLLKPHRKISNRVWLTNNAIRQDYKRKKVTQHAIFKGLAIQVSLQKASQWRQGFTEKSAFVNSTRNVERRWASVVFFGTWKCLKSQGPKCDIILKEQGVCVCGGGCYVFEHSPYSPDLASIDFFLFPRRKKNLAGRNITLAKR